MLSDIRSSAAQAEALLYRAACAKEDCAEAIRKINETCVALNHLISELAGVMAIAAMGDSPRITGRFSAETEAKYYEIFGAFLGWQARIDALLREYENKSEITAEDKDRLVTLFEKYHEEIALKTDALMSVLSPDDVREIKYLLYSSEEPVRSIYLNDLESWTIGNTGGQDTGYFTYLLNTINVDMAKEPANPRGPYTTFFHESGHALDYNYLDDGNFYSVTYRDENGNSLQDLIYSDVRADLEQVISQYTSDPASRQCLLDYILGAGFADIHILNQAERAVLVNIQNYYAREMAGPLNEACSDVYGGVTANIIHGSYGHWSAFYWYDGIGNATYAQSKELWAEYYSYRVTGNEEALRNLRKHFPHAGAFLDRMAESMGENAGN